MKGNLKKKNSAQTPDSVEGPSTRGVVGRAGRAITGVVAWSNGLRSSDFPLPKLVGL